TAWVISRVLDDQARLKRDGIAMQVSINISAQDLSDDGLKFLIEQKLQQNNLEAHDVCLEITERDMMTDVDKSLALLNYFRERGFQISMDDYGIGYSALSKLAQMPLNELKIDKCFILKLATQKDDQIIVRNTITMAHELGLSVIAEGVEDLESKDWLREAGCDYIQGYYLARPMACDALVKWLDEFKTAEKAE
ncbi:MAG: EAL domain-containing protein, partial [Thalassolituus oleivorans]